MKLGLMWSFLLMPYVLMYGYGYDIKGLRKWNGADKCFHYWIGICDFHDKTHQINTIQRAKIEECLPLYNPLDLLVIVEDLSSANNEGRLGCGSYCIQSRTGILAGLGNFCKQYTIPVCNVEYRYCRVVTLGPIINNIGAHPSLFSSTNKITLSNLVQEVQHAQTAFLNIESNILFKNILNEKSAYINSCMKKLNLLADQNKTIAEYLTPISPLNRLDLVKNILTFDGILIGLRIVDATMQAKDKKKIIAFGGGTHINEAYELLQKVAGYEPIFDSKPNSFISTILNKSIGAPIQNGYFAKPQPISVELLEHYLKN